MKYFADILNRSGCLVVYAAADLPEGSILNLDKSLGYNIVIQLINVIILITALAFILYKPVGKFLAARKRQISDEIEAARNIRDEAVQLRIKYEKMLKGIEAERDEVLQRTNKIAVEKSDQLLFEARREAEIIHNMARVEIETERENVENEIKRQIIEISHLMASRFVELSIDRETQNRLIEQALADWDSGVADESAVTAFGPQSGGTL